MDGLLNLWHATGIANFTFPALIMIAVGCLLLYLAIARNFEPLLLLPIGFGAILTNIPAAGLSEPGGLLYYVYHIGIDSGVFPTFDLHGGWRAHRLWCLDSKSAYVAVRCSCAVWYFCYFIWCNST